MSFEDMPADGEFLATYVQIEELSKTKDEGRRRRLLLAFSSLRPEIIHTETADWGIAPLGYFKLGTGQHYDSLKQALDMKNFSKPNNKSDVLIGEVALANGYTLLTADKHLAEVVQQFGGQVMLVAL